MGGFGSGRRSGTSGRPTTETFPALDIRRVKREGLLESPGGHVWRWFERGEQVASILIEVFPERLILTRLADLLSDRRGLIFGRVHLTWTDCHLGGQRPWFVCPGCSGRVAILFLGRRVLCRRCLGLAYASQRETAADRALRRANLIRRKLGWRPGIANPQGTKPPGMHWTTYWRLTCKHRQEALKALSGLRERLGRPPRVS